MTETEGGDRADQDEYPPDAPEKPPVPDLPSDQELEDEDEPGDEDVPEEDFLPPEEAAADDTVDDQEADGDGG